MSYANWGKVRCVDRCVLKPVSCTTSHSTDPVTRIRVQSLRSPRRARYHLRTVYMSNVSPATRCMLTHSLTTLTAMLTHSLCGHPTTRTSVVRTVDHTQVVYSLW